MDFPSAMFELKQGKKVRRREWEPSIYLHKKSLEIKSFRRESVPFNYYIDILISSGWIVEGILEELTFSEAILHTLSNRKIRFKDWTDDCWLEATNDKKELFMRKNSEYTFIPSYPCCIATDWEVIE